MSTAPSLIHATFLFMIVIDFPSIFLRWVWSLSGSVYCVDTKRPRQHLKAAAPFITEVLHFEGRRAGLKGLGYERLRTPVMFTAHKVATRSSQRHAPGLRSTQHNNTHPHPLTHPSLPLPIVKCQWDIHLQVIVWIKLITDKHKDKGKDHTWYLSFFYTGKILGE